MIRENTNMMNNPSHFETIWSYFSRNHILSVCASANNETWCANLFYAVHQPPGLLLIMTSENTKHGKLMNQNSLVSGTVYTHTKEVAQIQGVQFRGVVYKVNELQRAEALLVYQEAFPVARKRQDTLWQIDLTEVKMTDNTVGFGTKYTWQKDDLYR